MFQTDAEGEKVKEEVKEVVEGAGAGDIGFASGLLHMPSNGQSPSV